MGIFDIFKKSEPKKPANIPAEPAKEENLAAPAAPAVQPVAEPKEEQKGYLGDLEKTQRIAELLTLPREERDEQWVRQFLSDLPQASFRCGTPQIIAGPDGFPYFQIYLPEEGEKFQCYVVERMIGDFLLERGYGVVLNPGTGQPDWVLTYGDILNYHLHGDFLMQESFFSKSTQEEEIVSEGEEIMVGQPSEEILPFQTRKLLRDFFQLNGIDNPKVMLMMRKKGEDVTHDLVFNITPAQFETETHYRNMMQTVTWYLPRYYSVVGLQDDGSENGFMAL